MAIYILEDNIFQSNYLEKTIRILSRELGVKTGPICIASHMQTMLDYCREATEAVNLYFLDIKIKKNEVAGLSVAKQIRTLEPQAFIAFVTSYAEFALASFEYMTNAFAYILKTDDETAFQLKIRDCLVKYTNFLESQDPLDYFIYEDRFTSIKLPYRELLYLYTVSQHKIAVKTADEDICFHGTLKQLEVREPRLIRCHQSYLVNLDNAKIIDKSSRKIIFRNDLSIPIARQAMKKVQAEWGKMAGGEA